MRYNNDEYIKTHGKAPQGRGRWMFEIFGVQGTKEIRRVIDAHGTLKHARKQAIDEFRHIGNPIEVVTLP